MAWPKIKNIIILILLGANLGLLAFTVGREARNTQLQERARTNAIAFLREQGITVDDSLIPKSVTLTPQSVTRNVEQEHTIAAALLEGEVSVQARGAEVYRYSNENGSVQFHSNGEFLAQFTGNAMSAGDQSLPSHAAAVLERIGFQGRLKDTLQDGQGQGETVLTFQESWNGVPLLNCQASLTYQDGCLVSITNGRRLVGQPVEDSSSTPITVATALMKFYNGMNALGDVCSRIDTITPVYIVGSTISDPVPLTPVWCIATDTGTYQLDMLTGGLSRTLGLSI